MESSIGGVDDFCVSTTTIECQTALAGSRNELPNQLKSY